MSGQSPLQPSLTYKRLPSGSFLSFFNLSISARMACIAPGTLSARTVSDDERGRAAGEQSPPPVSHVVFIAREMKETVSTNTGSTGTRLQFISASMLLPRFRSLITRGQLEGPRHSTGDVLGCNHDLDPRKGISDNHAEPTVKRSGGTVIVLSEN